MQPATAQKDMKPQAYAFDPEILREYDIRGQIGKNLSEKDAYALGCAYGTYVRRKMGGNRICLGYDGRDSSPGLCEAMTRGLMDVGIQVERVGLGPTPMLYYAVKERNTEAGLMITGSHNPAGYNGFKMALQNGPVYGDAVQEIGKIAAAGDFETGTGSVADFDIQDQYIERLLRDSLLMKSGKKIRIAWDCGNGAAGEIIRRLTKKLPGEHILLFDEIDGTFPNHHPDPTVDKNLADLIRMVKEKKCDLGFAFDGDADRVGAVDENGDILRCDNLITVYAKDVLERNPGATIIGDVKCSQIMYDAIAAMGGKPLMWKTGHSLIKAKMYETRAPLAGELSGHIFFADGWYGFDDGIYCAIRLLDAIVKEDKTLSSLTSDLPKSFSTPEVRFEVDEKDKFPTVEKIVASVKDLAAKDPSITVNDIDGARVKTPDGWWLIRASNTQNVIVSRAESLTTGGLERLKSMVENEVAKLGYKISFEQSNH